VAARVIRFSSSVPGGRPLLAIDPEKQALERQAQELQAKLEVLEQTEQIGQRLAQPDKKSLR
jgi:hypothetical protein